MRPIRAMVRSWALAASVPLVLAGCEGGDPTASADLSASQAEALFAEAADRGAARIPTLPRLLHELRGALRDGAGVDAGVHALIEEFEAVRVAAREAHEGGDQVAARALAEEARHLQFEIIVTVLGPEVAANAVASVDAALQQIQDKLEGRRLPRPVAARLDAVADIVEAAKESLAGDPATALGLALRASEGLRGLSPEAFSARAAAAIERAGDVLEEARAAGSEGGDPRIAEALARAELFLERAIRGQEEGAYIAALELAQTSAQHSLRVIQLSQRTVESVS